MTRFLIALVAGVLSIAAFVAYQPPPNGPKQRCLYNYERDLPCAEFYQLGSELRARVQ
jgi:hypothetical protein